VPAGFWNLNTPHNRDVSLEPKSPAKEDVMLSKFFKCPKRLQELRGSPAGPSLEGFARQLCQIGYSTFTAKGHIRTAEHLAYWTDGEGLALAALNESSIQSFEHHLCRCRCPQYGGRTPEVD